MTLKLLPLVRNVGLAGALVVVGSATQKAFPFENFPVIGDRTLKLAAPASWVAKAESQKREIRGVRRAVSVIAVANSKAALRAAPRGQKLPSGSVAVILTHFPDRYAKAWPVVRRLRLPAPVSGSRQRTFHVRFAGQGVIVRVLTGSRPTRRLLRAVDSVLRSVRSP